MKISLSQLFVLMLALGGCLPDGSGTFPSTDGGLSQEADDSGLGTMACPDDPSMPCQGQGECAYSTGECLCSSPNFLYLCVDGVLVRQGRDGLGCEYGPNECNPAACPATRAAPCHEAGLLCWWLSCSATDGQADEYECVDGQFVPTGRIHGDQHLLNLCDAF